MPFRDDYWLIMGFLLSRALHAENNYLIMLSGVIGFVVGYMEFYLFRLCDREIAR